MILFISEEKEALCFTTPLSLTWNVQIAEAVSCCASNDVSSTSSTLDVSDTTACACGGTTEWRYTYMSDEMQNIVQEMNIHRGA